MSSNCEVKVSISASTTLEHERSCHQLLLSIFSGRINVAFKWNEMSKTCKRISVSIRIFVKFSVMNE